jgi:hypothetical protein
MPLRWIFEAQKGGMMNTQFREIDALEVRKYFSAFYDHQGRFFEIIHKGELIGFAGIRSFHVRCELEAFIFKQYRNALTKGIVLAVLGLPESLGFEKCWMLTNRKTVIKLLNAMGKYGIRASGLINGKHVFVREFK